MKTVERSSVLDRRHEIATAVFATWVAVGLHLDVWSHINRRTETIFTPWHAIIYSGIAFGVLFFVVDGAWKGTAVRADRATRAGFFIFVAAGIGDLIWHTIFGFEVSLRAFLSPTHLTMMLGGVLMMTGPLREARLRAAAYRSFRSFAPALVSLAAAMTLVTLFLQYLSPYNIRALDPDLYSEASGLAGVLIATAIVIGLALFLTREFVPPLGTNIVLFAVAALSAQSIQSFFRPLHIVGAALAGLVVDLAVRSVPEARQRMLRVAIVGPIGLWVCWLVVFALSGGIHWPAEIPPGIVLLSMFEGLALYAVLVSPPVPTV